MFLAKQPWEEKVSVEQGWPAVCFRPESENEPYLIHPVSSPWRNCCFHCSWTILKHIVPEGFPPH